MHGFETKSIFPETFPLTGLLNYCSNLDRGSSTSGKKTAKKKFLKLQHRLSCTGG
jgi:hypothetical protein